MYSKGNLEPYFEFLDQLRELGVTNMFGSAPYLAEAYPDINLHEARKILGEWMRTFDERHKED